MPRVSVTIPTYNCARFLGRSIATVLSQTYTDYEVIVVDDGSTDRTKEVIAQFEGKLRYVYQPNGGLSSARNLALSHASGELIAYLDADDMWYPSKLEKQVAFLDAHKQHGLVHSDVTIIDEQENVIHHRLNLDTQREFPEGYCVLDLLRRCHIQIPTVLERRACIERVGQFDRRLSSAQDYLHWIAIAMEGFAIGYIREPLAMYRRLSNSLSSNPRRVLEDYVTIFDTLLGMRSLALGHGHEAVEIVRGRMYSARRDLAHIDRREGRTDSSVRHITTLLREWPLRTELYLDLLKAYVGWALILGKRLRGHAEPVTRI